MTIYSDNAGNKFLGDCIYANHNIDYPNIKFLQAYPHSDISAELSAWLTASGVKFRNVLPQSDFNSYTQKRSLFTFGANSDSIDDRTVFAFPRYFSRDEQNEPYIAVYNNTGYAATNNVFEWVGFGTNQLYGISSVGTEIKTYDMSSNRTTETYSPSSTVSPFYWCGVSDNESVALFMTQYNFALNRMVSRFWYAGTVADVNTGFNYYSANALSSLVTFIDDARYGNDNIYGGHYIANTAKFLLSTGDAQYPIVCSDGQTPTSQWATDFYVFDDNATLGYPAIGKVRNLLLATGTYTIGKPVKLQGSVVPDNGSPTYLPVGTFAGKTVLMRCYSSVDIKVGI